MSLAFLNKSKKILKWGTMFFAVFLTAFLQPVVSSANVLQQFKPIDFNGTGFTKDSSIAQSGGAFTLALLAPEYKVVQSISSISGITSTAFDGTNLWVANGTASIYKISPITGNILATITATNKRYWIGGRWVYGPTGPFSFLTYDGVNVYAGAGSNNAMSLITSTSLPLYIIDTATNTLPPPAALTLTFSNAMVSNVVSVGSFFYASDNSGAINKIDSKGARTVLTTITAGSNPTSLATDGTYIYAKVNASGQKIYKVDITSGTTTVLGTNVISGSLAYNNSYLWATDPATNTVYKIDPSTGAIVKTSVISGNPASMIFTGTDDFWFVNSTKNTLSKVSSISSYPVGVYHTVQTPVVDLATLGYKGISKISVNQSMPANTDIKWLVSTDKGATWKIWTAIGWNPVYAWYSAVPLYSGSAPVTVGTSNINQTGMDVSVLQSLTSAEWGQLNASSVMFAFGINTNDSAITPSVSDITLTGVADVAKLSLSANKVYPDNKLTITANVASGYTAKNITLDYGDGSAVYTVDNKDKFVVDHKYTTSGTYTVKADVTLSTGETDTVKKTLNVQKPGATATIESKNLDDGNSPTQYYFKPTVTLDSPVDSVSKYEWTVKGSDGLSLQLGVDKKGVALYSVFGKSFLPVFSTPGDYTVDLKITPKYADPVTASTTVAVGTFVIPAMKLETYSPEHNRPPATYTFKATSSMKKDKITTFSWKITDPDGVVTIPTVQKKVNKVMTVVNEDRPNITFTFEKAGVWNIEVSTTTKNYGWQLVAKKQITVVSNQAPVIKNISIQTYPSGLTKLKVEASDTDGKIKATTLDLGDGTSLPYGESKHTYAKSGIYTVKATVTDDSGATASFQKNVTVSVTP